jgi:hypothetical protein
VITSGTRLESQACDTQVIVIKTTDALDGLRCGGAPMVPVGTKGAAADLDPRFSDGTALGKRYVHETGAEVLVTKAGAGTLTVNENPLELKQAKALPASD